MGKRENAYQAELRDRIEERIPGCYVFKNDPTFRQGVPDLVVLHPNGRWATLEVKREAQASKRPNQDYYVLDMNRKSYSAFIFPENEKEVLDEMESALESGGASRFSGSE